jgi:diguanylate cyclase (GGDEF)-like protein
MERDNYESRLKFLSFHDPLTGLYNRFAFDHEIRCLEQGRHSSVGIMVCDVDGLKKVNDELGHSQGDRLIQAAARNIAVSLRQGDMVARVGGDEFAVLLSDVSQEDCRKLQERIQGAVGGFNQQSQDLTLSVSIGCALWSQGEPMDLQQVFKQADDRMFEDKVRKRGLHRSEG